MDRCNRFWNGIVSSLVCFGVLIAVTTDADAHLIYQICDIGQTVEANTSDDPRDQRSRGAALRGAIVSWLSQARELGGEAYADYGVAAGRGSTCEAAGGGFICKVFGEPCEEVPSCNDPAVAGRNCVEGD